MMIHYAVLMVGLAKEEQNTQGRMTRRDRSVSLPTGRQQDNVGDTDKFHHF